MNKIVVAILSIFISSVTFASSAVVNSGTYFTFTRSIYVVAEGSRSVVSVMPHNLVGDTSVTIKVEGGSAVAGSDYIVPGSSGVFTIPFLRTDTDSKSFSIQTKADAISDKNETFKVSIIKINGVNLPTPINTVISIVDNSTSKVPAPTTKTNQSTTTSTNANSGISVAIDKANTAQNEAFAVTVTGLPSKYFTTGGILRFSRVGAPSTSCENSSRSDLCQVAVGVSCGILPKYMGASPTQWYADADGKLEFVCYANGENNNRNGAMNVNQSDQTYIAKVMAPAPVPFTNGGVTAPLVSENTASIVMKASGAQGKMTNYNNCPTGKGLDPYQVYRGCTDCQYVALPWRNTISSCQNTVAVTEYRWNMHTPPSSIFDHPQQSCSFATAGLPVGDTGVRCTAGAASCQVGTSAKDPNAKIFNCTPNGGNSFDTPKGLYGVVKDEKGQPVAGVKVTAPFVGFGSSWTATTDEDGKYVISNVEPAGISHLNFSKVGYIADGMLAKLGENETFTLRAVPASGAVETCPTNVFRSTLANNPCTCPAGTNKELSTGGFICTIDTTAPNSGTVGAPVKTNGVQKSNSIDAINPSLDQGTTSRGSSGQGSSASGGAAVDNNFGFGGLLDFISGGIGNLMGNGGNGSPNPDQEPNPDPTPNPTPNPEDRYPGDPGEFFDFINGSEPTSGTPDGPSVGGGADDFFEWVSNLF